MRSRLLLICALVVGAMTTFLFYRYMQQFDGRPAADTKLVSVVVAAKPIAHNEAINASMLSMVQVPEDAAFAGTMRDEAAAIGKVAGSDIAQGEPILADHLSDVKEEDNVVSRKIGDGLRGVSVGVNFVQSVSNLIEPEDRVDVIVAVENPQTKEITTTMLLENIRVLAVGRRMVGVDKAHPYAEYSAATLEVSREDSVKLVDAAARGTITLSLHSRVSEQGKPSKGGASDGT